MLILPVLFGLFGVCLLKSIRTFRESRWSDIGDLLRRKVDSDWSNVYLQRLPGLLYLFVTLVPGPKAQVSPSATCARF